MVDRSSIEKLLKQAAKEPTSLRTVLDDTRKLYEQTSVVPAPPPKPKRRKMDIRTLRKKQRKEREERADYRRRMDGSLRAQFFKLRREAIRQRRKWELSLDEWLKLWFECPAIQVSETVTEPAHKLRGRKKTDVQLHRRDKSLPYPRDNLIILHNEKIILDSRTLFQDGSTSPEIKNISGDGELFPISVV